MAGTYVLVRDIMGLIAPGCQRDFFSKTVSTARRLLIAKPCSINSVIVLVVITKVTVITVFDTPTNM